MDITPFQFQDITLHESCWMGGKPYFTRQSIGEWLGYKQPRSAIKHIIDRNPHIEDDRWSVVVNLATTDGKKYDTRVYDPIGFQLIVFRSNQPKAIQYQIAVANLAWAFMNGQLKPSKWTQMGDLVSAGRQIHSMKPCFERGEMMRDLADREECSTSTIYRRIQRATGKRLRKNVRTDRGRSRYPNEKATVLAYASEHPESRGAEIRKIFNLTVSANRINFWLRDNRRKNELSS